jgi:Relaxase/Mobilisation nuclease domain
MIPRINTGTSFTGAGLYYLHDKLQEGETERLTTDRLAWTHALNTVENEPEAVLAEMRQTAFDQPMLKMLSGNRIDGRPTDKPVLTVALSWAPTQSPTKEQMIEAGQSYLKHMRWDAHQCLMVAHNDTKHPHLHLIVNTVHPETGMALDASWTKTRSHQWALKYEREHGQVLCAAREGKYEGERHGGTTCHFRG